MTENRPFQARPPRCSTPLPLFISSGGRKGHDHSEMEKDDEKNSVVSTNQRQRVE